MWWKLFGFTPSSVFSCWKSLQYCKIYLIGCSLFKRFYNLEVPKNIAKTVGKIKIEMTKILEITWWWPSLQSQLMQMFFVKPQKQLSQLPYKLNIQIIGLNIQDKVCQSNKKSLSMLHNTFCYWYAISYNLYTHKLT